MVDTTHEAASIQIAVLRRLAPIERLRIAIEMSVTARELGAARLRRDHPDWPEPRIHAELLRPLLPVGHPAAL